MQMVRRAFLLSLGLMVAVLALPRDVEAQPRLVIGAGVSNPLGDLGDRVESGYHGRLALQLGVPVFPVSLRAEGAVHSFPASGLSEGSMTQLEGALSAVFSVGGIGIGPYFFGGVGRYKQDYSTEFGLGEAQTDRGLHAGFGVNLGLLGFGGFAEARVVNIDTETGNNRFVPITVGIRF